MTFYPPFKSESKPYAAGSTIEFTNFVNAVGPNGGRVVVDRLCLRVTGTITVATAVWDGRDVARMFNFVTVEKKDGRLRWALSGARTRAASIFLNGIDQWTEHGNVAIGAGQAVDAYINIPLKKRYAKGGDAYSLPADLLAKITAVWGANTDMQTGTTVLSAINLSAYVLAEWHEELKFVSHVDDLVRSIDFQSQTDAKITPTGNVQDIFIHKVGTTAGGGELLTAITDVRIEELGMPLLSRADLLWNYSYKRYATPSGPTTPATERFLDPAREGKVVPVFTSDEDTRAFDGKMGIQNFRIIAGTGVASSTAIYRETVAKSQADFQAEQAQYGVAKKDLTVKTANGNDHAFTPAQRAVLPWEAPLTRAA